MQLPARRYVALLAVGVGIAAAGAWFGSDCYSQLTMHAEAIEATEQAVPVAELSPEMRSYVRQAVNGGTPVVPTSIIQDPPTYVEASSGSYLVQYAEKPCPQDKLWFAVVFVGAMVAVAGFAGVLQQYLGGFDVHLNRRRGR